MVELGKGQGIVAGDAGAATSARRTSGSAATASASSPTKSMAGNPAFADIPLRGQPGARNASFALSERDTQDLAAEYNEKIVKPLANSLPLPRATPGDLLATATVGLKAITRAIEDCERDSAKHPELTDDFRAAITDLKRDRGILQGLLDKRKGELAELKQGARTRYLKAMDVEGRIGEVEGDTAARHARIKELQMARSLYEADIQAGSKAEPGQAEKVDNLHARLKVLRSDCKALEAELEVAKSKLQEARNEWDEAQEDRREELEKLQKVAGSFSGVQQQNEVKQLAASDMRYRETFAELHAQMDRLGNVDAEKRALSAKQAELARRRERERSGEEAAQLSTMMLVSEGDVIIPRHDAMLTQFMQELEKASELQDTSERLSAELDALGGAPSMSEYRELLVQLQQQSQTLKALKDPGQRPADGSGS
jgi:chromosome segregation ATPase